MHDAIGGAIPAATVRIVTRGAEPLRLEMQTDEEGRFGFDAPDGEAYLTAEAQGYAPARAAFVSPTASAELVLVPESVIQGRVVSAIDGRPVPGVQVSALPRSAPLLLDAASAASDETGVFEIRAIEAGVYNLIARGERSYGVSSVPVEVELAGKVEGVVVEVVPAVTVRGLVSQADGEPCSEGFAMLGPTPDPMLLPPEGIAALAQASEAHVESYLAPLREDGELAFQGVQRGRYHLVLRCAGAVWTSGPRLIEVTDQDVVDLAWRVEPMHRLTVLAVDEASQPVAGATLLLKFNAANAKGRKGLMPATTDAQGIATFAELLPGQVEVQPNGADTTPPVAVTIERGARDTRATVKLTGSGYIALSARDAAGKDVDRLRVSARSEGTSAVNAEQQVQSVAIARGAGRYRIGPLSPGLYTVSARDGINAPLEVAHVRVASRTEVQVSVVTPARGEIAGRVVDDRGAPVGNVWVSAMAAEARADAEPTAERRGRALSDGEGAFVLRDLNVGGAGYEVRAEPASGVVAIRKGVKVGASVELTLPAPLTLVGTIMDDATRPANGASVRARHEDTGATRVVAVRRDGRFELTGLTPGRIELVAFASDGRSVSRQLSLEAGARPAEVTLSLAEVQTAAAELAPPAAP